ncbi:MAG TPA: HD-GYP domain-containing protein [Solirubrobacterales bacterium]
MYSASTNTTASPHDLAVILRRRDPGIYGHSQRVPSQAAAIARELGLPEEEVTRIHHAGLLHDIGKTFTPKTILDKASALSPEEMSVVKRHAEVGALMVRPLGDPALTEIVLHHHERLDGGGYPAGLRGEEIPLGARLVAVADTFDALTSTRPYRGAHTEAEALAVLEEVSGSQLDPVAVSAFQRQWSSRRRRRWLNALPGRRRVGRQLRPARLAADPRRLARFAEPPGGAVAASPPPAAPARLGR